MKQNVSNIATHLKKAVGKLSFLEKKYVQNDCADGALLICYIRTIRFGGYIASGDLQ